MVRRVFFRHYLCNASVRSSLEHLCQKRQRFTLFFFKNTFFLSGMPLTSNWSKTAFLGCLACQSKKPPWEVQGTIATVGLLLTTPVSWDRRNSFMFPDLAFSQNESHYWVQLATPRFVRHKGAVYNTAFCEAHFFCQRNTLPCTIFWSVLIPLGLAHNCVEGHSLTCAIWTIMQAPQTYISTFFFFFCCNR